MAFIYDDPNAPATAPGARNMSPLDAAIVAAGGTDSIDPAILAAMQSSFNRPNINNVPPVPSIGMPHRHRVLPQIHSLQGQAPPSHLQVLLQQALNPTPQPSSGTFNLHQHNARGIAQAMGLAHNLQFQRQMSRLLRRFVGR
jgi:hypothetical protein